MTPGSGHRFVDRAHRRFLGLAAPLPVRDEGDAPIQTIEFAAGSRTRFAEHLATAGAARSGLLLGHRAGDRFLVSAILGAGYGWAPTLSLLPVPHYTLGAVDAARQLSPHPVDWIGTWVMGAGGLAQPEPADLPVWQRARALALVSADTVLVTVGDSTERLVVRAWVEDDEQPRALEVVWAQAGGAP